jgi:ABC-type transport system involved in Fe-S cluster assembly fused permease/ATPase subunit
MSLVHGRAGTKATTAVFNAAVFGLLPLLAELPLVCAAISTVSRPSIGVLVAAVSLLYIAFTISMTEVPTRADMPSARACLYTPPAAPCSA